MTGELVAFALIATTAVGAALGLILKRNPIHGALFLVVNLACVAALYLMLGAEFLAAAQIIVYAGAIMVLIPGKEETGPDPRRLYRLAAVPVGALLLIELAMIMTSRRALPATAPAAGGVEAIGRLLFTDYLFPFELTSILLLAAMVGVLLLARRRAST